MASYRCLQCGESFSETRFCHLHGPMECVEEVEVRRLKELMRAFGEADIAFDDMPGGEWDNTCVIDNHVMAYGMLKAECRRLAKGVTP